MLKEKARILMAQECKEHFKRIIEASQRVLRINSYRNEIFTLNDLKNMSDDDIKYNNHIALTKEEINEIVSLIAEGVKVSDFGDRFMVADSVFMMNVLKTLFNNLVNKDKFNTERLFVLKKWLNILKKNHNMLFHNKLASSFEWDTENGLLIRDPNYVAMCQISNDGEMQKEKSYLFLACDMRKVLVYKEENGNLTIEDGIALEQVKENGDIEYYIFGEEPRILPAYSCTNGSEYVCSQGYFNDYLIQSGFGAIRETVYLPIEIDELIHVLLNDFGNERHR